MNPSSSAPNPSDFNNVDPSEIGKFDALAADWWDPKGQSGPLHTINPVRLDWIEGQLDSFEGKKVLDVMAKEPGYYGWIQNADFPRYTKKVLTAIKLRSFNK